MKEIVITAKQNKCLREHLNAIADIVGGKVVFSDGLASERKAVRKEPTQSERVKNYAELLDSKGKYQKPKHLRQ